MIKHILSSLLVCVALTACVNDKEADEPVWSLQMGDPLPEFTVTMNDGAVWTTDDLMDKACVIIFFHTGCPDCRALLPSAQVAYNTYSEQGVPLLLISREEDAASIEAYWKKHGYYMPYSAQTDRHVYNLFASSGIPRLYRAHKGEIYSVETFDGLYEDFKEFLENYIE